MRRRYRGWFGQHARRRCPHEDVVGIYGDAIIHCGSWRLFCRGCGMYLDGSVDIAQRARRGDR